MRPKIEMVTGIGSGLALRLTVGMGLMCGLVAGGGTLLAQQAQSRSLGSIGFGGADYSPHKPLERSLQGTVQDKSGAAIPGALVYLKEGGKSSVAVSVADAKGTYRFGPLARDTDYEVWAKVNGKTSASKMISSFNSNDTIIMSLQMQ